MFFLDPHIQKAIDILNALGFNVGPAIVELLEIVEGDISNTLELLGFEDSHE